MKKIIAFIFSMPFTGALLIIFAVSIGYATFIESSFGTSSAKYLVYNAKWFEILLLIITVNLLGNIFKNKLYSKEKITIFLFHISFVFILLGAAVTRYIGFEGIMHIRENEKSDNILSSNMYIHLTAKINQSKQHCAKQVLFSPFSKKNFLTNIQTPEGKITVSTLDYIPNALSAVNETEHGNPMIYMVYTTSLTGRKNLFIKETEAAQTEFLSVGFNAIDSCDINILKENDEFIIKSKYKISRANMMTANADDFTPVNSAVFYPMTIYTVQGINFVFVKFYEKAVVNYETSDENSNPDVVILKIKGDKTEKEMALTGKNGLPGEHSEINIGNAKIIASYSPGSFQLPFSLKLNNFKLERYPGSNSPSSYASFITLTDNQKNVQFDSEISMNNILRYRGYRFYQSSYDEDEMGTVLSVNHDMAGTTITYIGYILLALGMLLSIFNKNSRLRKLSMSVKILIVFISINLFSILPVSAGQTEIEHNNHIIDYTHSRKVDFLMVQDNKGRLKPFNTFSSELLRKVSGKTGYNGLHANQVVLGMMIDPGHWQQQPMIKVSNPEVRKILEISSKYAAFVDFFKTTDRNSNYILSDLVNKAYMKQPGDRSKLDNEIIKTDERLNICYLIFTGDLFKILPNPLSMDNKWYAYTEIPDSIVVSDSVKLKSIIPLYFNQVYQATQSNNWKDANELVTLLIDFQRKYASEIMPSGLQIKMEVFYNQLNIFDRLSGYYGLLGFVFLILLFVSEISGKYSFKKLKITLMVIGALFFIFHTAGLAVRWYVSGHAPWSNGYESMIYISWATVLAGVLFTGKSYFAPAATFILAFIILHVAHLSWLDPEITNLVPVLKSYWLTIHVSVITASYGFLGLTALLASVNLIFMVFKTINNYKRIDGTIIAITSINEMSIIIGLYLLTTGTFLGGVWANESWGRYWGWDPKETWALVTVLLYAFIAHMRFIPALKGLFVFNLFSLIGYGSVIMTYFGVNYYLAGLHSYAKGDPAPVPSWVVYTVLIIIAISVSAWYKNKKINEKIKSE